MKEAVLDNSVLSAYSKIGRLDLLKVVLKDYKVYVAHTVHREVVFPGVLAELSFKGKKGGWIIVEKADIAGFTEFSVDSGEAGTVSLAAKKKATAILDDLSGRKLAKKHGVPLIGTLGLLRLAFEKKLVSAKELEAILRDLETKDSFRMSAELKKWVLGR